MRALIFVLAALALFPSACGKGGDLLTRIGICDGYPEPATSPYHLPWTVGASKTISQGNCSSTSHNSSSRFAYDISMSSGTPVLAARAGTVLKIKEDMTDGNGCPDENYVYIEHSDGTVAHYLHLTLRGALVSTGEIVIQGQQIGLSGNTGCTTGAHLHFEVVKSRSSAESVAVSFSNTSSESRVLKSGSSYTPL